MAQAITFSPNFLGKRGDRSGRDEPDYSMSDHYIYSSEPSSDALPLKKSRNQGSPFSSPLNSMDRSTSINFSCQKRSNNENVPNEIFSVTSDYQIQELRYQNSQLTSRMIQNEMLVQKKEHELQESKNLIARLLTELQRKNEEQEQHLEENRILKRAVHIQDLKIKELTEQNQHYEQVIKAAMQYFESQETEKRSKALAQHSASSSDTYFDLQPPPPPPDVF
jgi:hypothetical protein